MAKYKLNPHNHVKIWFSEDENVFLNPENQLRLVQFRARNPKDIVYFVYAKYLLNETAQAELETFCARHHFLPLSIETVQKEVSSHKEKIMLEWLHREIEATKNKTGGNLAAPSDIARWLSAIFKRGIYSDFDTEIHTTGLPQSITVTSPIITNGGSVDCSEMHRDLHLIVMNNDILALPQPLDEEAHKLQKAKIELAQTNLIKNYIATKSQIKKYVRDFEQAFSQLPPELAQFIKQFSELNLLEAMSEFGDDPIAIRQKGKEICSSTRDFTIMQVKLLAKLSPFMQQTCAETLGCSLQEAMDDIKYDRALKESYLQIVLVGLQVLKMLTPELNQSALHSQLNTFEKIYETSGMEKCLEHLMSKQYQK